MQMGPEQLHEVESKVIDALLNKVLTDPQWSLTGLSLNGGILEMAQKLLYGTPPAKETTSKLEVNEFAVRTLRSTLEAKEVENQILLKKYNDLLKDSKIAKNAGSIDELESQYEVTPESLATCKIPIPQNIKNEVKVDGATFDEVIKRISENLGPSNTTSPKIETQLEYVTRVQNGVLQDAKFMKTWKDSVLINIKTIKDWTNVPKNKPSECSFPGWSLEPIKHDESLGDSGCMSLND